ncbi:major facilitator superfamily MFS_1 [Acidimicrobium ferrooxidans DSM 10331]|uniref:Major facilitator superfamily MFS_1 n=1 Tax=Acidimicrobium ferrooxidans (strain DSM 10331 / JCM 15462 / NBRC 103882 / ICP) TaxID=525909 RepID=C7LZB5_ACIFD|nr:MFS transporter [Acidimicrobium ferrooxidans]ACU54073.1 major facilitator superfamily MFS_1 [Acidimicrobium ferrooxidans DSM 10331]
MSSGVPRTGLVLPFSIAATTATTLPVFLIGGLEPVLRHAIDLTPSLEGAVVASFFVAGIVGAALAARILHRAAAFRLVRAGAGASAVASAVIAFAVRGPILLAAALVVAGAANGILQPGVNEVLARVVRPGRRGWAFGIKQAAIPTATLLAGLALPLVALRSSWRTAFAATSILAVAIALGAKGFASYDGSQGAEARTRFVTPRSLLIVAAAMALGAGTANALGAFGVASLVHDHVQAAIAGYAAAAGSAAGLATRVGMGALADRRLQRPIRAVAVLLAVGVVGYAALATGVRALLLGGLLLGYAGGWGWNGLVNFAVSERWPEHPGQATAIVQASAFAGSVVGPLGFGALVGAVGFHGAWVIDAVGALVACLGMLWASVVLERTGRATGR